MAPKTAQSAQDLDLAQAFAGALSGKEFKNLKVEFGDEIGYNAKTDTMVLPGVPFGDVPEEVKDDLRAYIAHESFGERGNSTWVPADHAPATRRIINGMNDARIDRLTLEQWPGAGMAIRQRLRKDWMEYQKKIRSGTYDTSKPGVLSTALRYIGENIATREEVAALDPKLADSLERIKPLLDATDWDGSEDHIVRQAQEITRSLGLVEEEETSPPPKSKSMGWKEGDEGTGKGKKPERGDGKVAGGDGKVAGKDKKESEGSDMATMEERLKDSLRQRLRPMGKMKGKQVFVLPPDSIKRSAPKPGQPCLSDRVTVGRIMRLFRSLQAAEDRVLLKHRLVGELDPDRLADLHRGSARLFSARKRAETESLAVYISVDLTGSMGGLWRVFVQRFVASLNEALGRLEIPTAIVGWDGGSPRDDWRKRYTQPYPTRFFDIKTFDEPWKRGSGRLSIVSPGWANADVGALGDGISQLARRRETRKLMFYITDGCPCLDYDPEFEVEYNLLGHTMKQIVEKGRRVGITTVACGVGLHDSSRITMDTIFGAENYAVVSAEGGEATLGGEFERTVKRIVSLDERKRQ